MQRVEDSKLSFRAPLSEEDNKRLVSFFEILLEWDIENEQNAKQENQEIQTPAQYEID